CRSCRHWHPEHRIAGSSVPTACGSDCGRPDSQHAAGARRGTGGCLMRILPLAVVILMGAAVLWSVLGASQAADSTLAELPREYVDTRQVEPDGQVLRLAAGDDLQRALNLAQPGDVIELEAGAVF